MGPAYGDLWGVDYLSKCGRGGCCLREGLSLCKAAYMRSEIVTFQKQIYIYYVKNVYVYKFQAET